MTVLSLCSFVAALAPHFPWIEAQSAVWKEWPIREAGFAIEMPSRPYTTQLGVGLAKPGRKATLFRANAGDEDCRVHVYEDLAMAWTHADAEIDALEKGYVAASRGKQVESRRFHWGPFRAKDTVLFADQRHSHLRSIFVGQRLYFIAVQTADNTAKSAVAKRRLESFRFIEAEDGA